MTAPYCKKGSRRCSVSKQCLRIKGSRSEKCRKNTRKCANSKCYNKNKSVKSRNKFNVKYR